MTRSIVDHEPLGPEPVEHGVADERRRVVRVVVVGVVADLDPGVVHKRLEENHTLLAQDRMHDVWIRGGRDDAYDNTPL
jgi:hypothetical protein